MLEGGGGRDFRERHEDALVWNMDLDGLEHGLGCSLPLSDVQGGSRTRDRQLPAGGRPGLAAGGLAGSRGVAASRHQAKSAIREPRLRATRAARLGRDICQMPGRARTFVRIGISNFYCNISEDIH